MFVQKLHNFFNTDFCGVLRQYLKCSDRSKYLIPVTIYLGIDVSAFHCQISHYNSLRKSSLVKPASRTMFPIVIALIGLCRGIVMIRVPSVITICLPWRATQKPAFSKARSASRWFTPGSFGITTLPWLPLRGPFCLGQVPPPLPDILQWHCQYCPRPPVQ